VIEPRIVESGPSEHRRGRLSRVAGRLAPASAAVLVLAGCVSHNVASDVNRRLEFGMSTSEIATANRVALREARRDDARVTARASVSGQETAQPPDARSRPCASGRLIRITLVGEFPHAPKQAARIYGRALTVDAATGRLCEGHYLNQPVVTDLSSVLLFSN
jgi:hypothetical protein